MIDTQNLDTAALSLVFILGLRHGLDPDHIAVVDNLTFRAAEERPALAPWTGTFFALGHSLSVALVAIGASLLSSLFIFPTWIGGAFDGLVITLLLLVGGLNLRALLRNTAYRPVGWRYRLMPLALRETTHPAAILGVGMVFGLVFDTATQAAAWGTAASAGGGMTGALLVAAVFALGMVLTDTVDSQIVARLMSSRSNPARVDRYRRGVGWLIVGLSFGMAAYALATIIAPAIELPDPLFTGLGGLMTLLVISLHAADRRAANVD